jgi:hypothetical protein
MGWLFVWPAIFRVRLARLSARIVRPARVGPRGQLQEIVVLVRVGISRPMLQVARPAIIHAPLVAIRRVTVQLALAVTSGL